MYKKKNNKKEIIQSPGRHSILKNKSKTNQKQKIIFRNIN